MFFHYNQNNSGSSFIIDDNVHINVIIEAKSAKLADRKAQKIGIYFNGCDDGTDCECCGDRWHPAYEDYGAEVPSIYDQPLSNPAPKDSMRWTNDGIRAYVYYADGRKEVVKY